MVPSKNNTQNSTNKKIIIKYVQTPNCNYCGEEETLSHMLWTCQESQSIITQPTKYLIDKNIGLDITEELFIFNIGNIYSSADLQIFTIIKHYIYSAKRLNQHLSLTTLLKKSNIVIRLNNIQQQNKRQLSEQI